MTTITWAPNGDITTRTPDQNTVTEKVDRTVIQTTPDGTFLGRVDWYFPELRIVVECDSFLWHGAWHRRKRDLRRDRRLVAAGYTVLRFSWEDLTDLPDQVIVDLVDVSRQLAA